MQLDWARQRDLVTELLWIQVSEESREYLDRSFFRDQIEYLVGPQDDEPDIEAAAGRDLTNNGTNLLEVQAFVSYANSILMAK